MYHLLQNLLSFIHFLFFFLFHPFLFPLLFFPSSLCICRYSFESCVSLLFQNSLPFIHFLILSSFPFLSSLYFSSPLPNSYMATGLRGVACVLLLLLQNSLPVRIRTCRPRPPALKHVSQSPLRSQVRKNLLESARVQSQVARALSISSLLRHVAPGRYGKVNVQCLVLS